MFVRVVSIGGGGHLGYRLPEDPEWPGSSISGALLPRWCGHIPRWQFQDSWGYWEWVRDEEISFHAQMSHQSPPETPTPPWQPQWSHHHDKIRMEINLRHSRSLWEQCWGKHVLISAGGGPSTHLSQVGHLSVCLTSKQDLSSLFTMLIAPIWLFLSTEGKLLLCPHGAQCHHFTHIPTEIGFNILTVIKSKGWLAEGEMNYAFLCRGCEGVMLWSAALMQTRMYNVQVLKLGPKIPGPASCPADAGNSWAQVSRRVHADRFHGCSLYSTHTHV